jgi:hypothetical protein
VIEAATVDHPAGGVIVPPLFTAMNTNARSPTNVFVGGESAMLLEKNRDEAPLT